MEGEKKNERSVFRMIRHPGYAGLRLRAAVCLSLIKVIPVADSVHSVGLRESPFILKTLVSRVQDSELDWYASFRFVYLNMVLRAKLVHEVQHTWTLSRRGITSH